MEYTNKPIPNLLIYNGINSSNAVYDSGGALAAPDVSMLNQSNGISNSAQPTDNSQISALIFMVAPFSVIFLFCVTGNLLVIATLAINRRMRTAFNAFLLNLAIADLLLGIFCMPFTLSGFIMKEFIFGALMCRLIPYLQAVSVSVSSWTLVTMSVERYYATCQPLKSKSYRQNWAHVFKVIGGVWLLSFIVMSPIAYLSELMPTNENKMKCRESWPSNDHLIFFTYFLDILIFVIPLFIMMISYFLIALKFILMNKQHENQQLDGQASYQITTRQSSIDATYADGDTFMGTQSQQTNYSPNFHGKGDSSPMVRSSPLANHHHSNHSPLRLEPINGRVSGGSRTRHRSNSPNSHELLSARSSTTNKPKTISFSSSLENVSLDDKELALADGGVRDHGSSTPSPSILNGDEPVFKSASKSNSEQSRTSESGGRREGLDSVGRSSMKIDHRNKQISDQRLSLRKKDKNNNQEKARKPSSSTISSGGQHGSSSNENSLFIANEHHKLDAGDRSTLAVGGSICSKEINAMKLRSSVDRRLAQKRQSRVIKMLAILVLEFFTCWCPLHIINLISLYKPALVYQAIGYDGLGLFFLLAYSSSCTNPITYCFMNVKFRQSFMSLFGCRSEKRNSKQILKKPKIRSTTIEEL